MTRYGLGVCLANMAIRWAGVSSCAYSWSLAKREIWLGMWLGLEVH